LGIPALLGFLSAGQQIYAKQGSDLFGILWTGWGDAYWVSRIIVPVGGYIAWYYLQTTAHHSIVAATVWGLGTEAILRSKFYIGNRTSSDGKQDEISKGVFDLIEWWQRLALQKANVASAARKQKLVNRLTQHEENFFNFCQRVRNHAGGLDPEQRDAVLAKTNELFNQFEHDGGRNMDNQQHRDWCRVLSYSLLMLVGKRGLTLLANRD
jgi:hypothetical protein